MQAVDDAARLVAAVALVAWTMARLETCEPPRPLRVRKEDVATPPGANMYRAASGLEACRRGANAVAEKACWHDFSRLMSSATRETLD